MIAEKCPRRWRVATCRLPEAVKVEQPGQQLRSQCRPEGAEAEAVPRREPRDLTLFPWQPEALDEVERRVGSEGGLESDRFDDTRAQISWQQDWLLLFDDAKYYEP
jgi:hypothetical protein